MHQDTLLDKIGKLPIYMKMIGFGSLITLISVFLPWYQDLDAFNTGDMFIGLSGPLYLLGFLILTLSLGSFAIFMFRFLGKPLPKLPLRESHNHVFAGVFNLFLLLITNSIYFHSKFGINITQKEIRFGMILAFAGAVLVVLGGMMQNKKREVSFESEGKLDKLIDVDRNREAGHINEQSVEDSQSEILEKTTETISVSIEGDQGDKEQNNLF